uniref:DUF2442 domain-containing protein n=1 Tax=Eubacterium cellulosolvens TaxID=29322 RepID=UPI001FA7D92D|nr:DUF2442 domain-containing protein [[Eubacterium] cellulosolvens]
MFFTQDERQPGQRPQWALDPAVLLDLSSIIHCQAVYTAESRIIITVPKICCFHKVKAVTALPDYRLSVQFAEGVTKIYDIKPLFEKWAPFKILANSSDLFFSVEVDPGGYGIIWNDDLDLSCDELYENGESIKTPFDGLMAFTDATQLWGLNESTLRKAIAYGKLINGVDACKYGKQWVISTEAMKREYGLPKVPAK